MGWFLTSQSNKTTKKKATKRKGKGASPSWDPERTMLSLKLLGCAALIVGTAIGWRMMEKGLQHYVAKKYSKSDYVVSLINTPQWMSEPRFGFVFDDIETVTLQAVCPDAENPPSPLDGLPLKTAAKDLRESSMWISKLYQVRRIGTNKIEIDADYREPVALVASADGYVAVDEAGFVLPMVLQTHQVANYDIPLINGVGNIEIGKASDSSRLHAGIAVANLIRYEPYANQIACINVSSINSYGQTQVVLQTEQGEVVWHKAPGKEGSTDVSAAMKIERLRKLASDPQTGGYIDYGGRVVSIYGPSVTVEATIGTAMNRY